MWKYVLVIALIAGAFAQGTYVPIFRIEGNRIIPIKENMSITGLDSLLADHIPGPASGTDIVHYTAERLGRFSEITQYNGAIVLPFDATTDEDSYFTICLDEGYDDGEDITGSIIWMPATADTGTVTWVVEWEAVALGSAPTGTGTKIVITDQASEVQYQMQQTDEFTISGAGLTSGTAVFVDLYRDADASETGADDDYPEDAGVSQSVVFVPMDKAR